MTVLFLLLKLKKKKIHLYKKGNALTITACQINLILITLRIKSENMKFFITFLLLLNVEK